MLGTRDEEKLAMGRREELVQIVRQSLTTMARATIRGGGGMFSSIGEDSPAYVVDALNRAEQAMSEIEDILFEEVKP